MRLFHSALDKFVNFQHSFIYRATIRSFLSFQNLDFQNEAKLRLAPGQVQHYSYERKIHFKDFVNTCPSFKMIVGETLKFSIEITALMSSRKTFRLHSWSFKKLSFACLAGGIVMNGDGLCWRRSLGGIHERWLAPDLLAAPPPKNNSAHLITNPSSYTG